MYGCDMLTLREEHAVRVLKKQSVRRIFGLMTAQVTIA